MGEIFFFFFLYYLERRNQRRFRRMLFSKILFFFFRIGKVLGIVNVGFFVSFSVFFWKWVYIYRREEETLRIFYFVVKVSGFFFFSLQIPFEMKGMSGKKKKENI